MSKQPGADLPTLKEVEKVTAFPGFVAADFAVFALPDFGSRMPSLKAQITPKLKALGEALLPALNRAGEETLYPHVAQHLRRTVNPPEETWVAFAKNRKAYKPYVHYRVAISAEKVRVLVFVEDDAVEKAAFADHLAQNAEPLAEYLARHPFLLAYDIPDESGEPKRGHALDANTLRSFAARLRRVKAQHAAFGAQFAASHHALRSGPETALVVLETLAKLKPIYALGTSATVVSPREVTVV